MVCLEHLVEKRSPVFSCQYGVLCFVFRCFYFLFSIFGSCTRALNTRRWSDQVKYFVQFTNTCEMENCADTIESNVMTKCAPTSTSMSKSQFQSLEVGIHIF